MRRQEAHNPPLDSYHDFTSSGDDRYSYNSEISAHERCIDYNFHAQKIERARDRDDNRTAARPDGSGTPTDSCDQAALIGVVRSTG